MMADEVTDASNREQVVECFRWVGSDFEDFVGFHKVDKVNAVTLAAVIKHEPRCAQLQRSMS